MMNSIKTMKNFKEDVLEYIPQLGRFTKFYIEQLMKKRNKATIRFLIWGLLSHFFNPGEGRGQKKLIWDGDWDVLIVLDACRYDIFEKEYKDFLSGELIKALSPASGTGPWLNRVLGGYYPDIQVISSNPRINSKGVVICGYNAIKHFPRKNIVDVWDYGWDHKLNTVHPRTVVEEALKHWDDSKRHIIWFMQPHGPWIGEPSIITSSSMPIEGEDEAVVSLLRRDELSLDKFREAYRGNLRLVLKYVAELVDKIDNKKIVVISDHGELLGEYGSFLHYSGLTAPELREVPFLKLKR